MLRRVAFIVVILAICSVMVPGLASAEHDPNVDLSPNAATGDGVLIDMGEERQSEWEKDNKYIEWAQHHMAVPPEHASYFVTARGAEYIILSSREHRTAKAEFRGFVLRRATESTPGVIATMSVEVQHDSEHVRLDELRRNPDQYHFKLVTVESTYSQIAYANDYQDLHQPVTVGYLGGLPPSRLFGVPESDVSSASTVARAGVWSVRNMSNSSRPPAVESALRVLPGRNTVFALSTESDFWKESQGYVTGVAISRGPLMDTNREVMLYLTDTVIRQDKNIRIDDIPDVDPGTVVEFQATMVGQAISSKQTLLKSAPCGSPSTESVAFPSVGCVPVTTDTIVHVGALYGAQTPPDGNRQVVPYAGLSNGQVSGLAEMEHGVGNIKGRVVDTKTIDPRLPPGNAVIVYSVDIEGQYDVYADVGEQLRDDMVPLLNSQLTMSRQKWKQTRSDAMKQRRLSTPTPSPTPSPTPTPTPSATPTDSPTPTETPDGSIELTGVERTGGQGNGLGVLLAIFSIIVAVGRYARR